MPLTMQERFELAKAQQLRRSVEVKKETGNKKAVSPKPISEKLPPSAHQRKKYRDYLMSLDNKSCGICQIQFTENTRFMHLDHCHTTGDIRGLLCHNCNIGLGCFKDNIIFLEAAIDYLLTVDRKTKDKIEKHPKWTTPIKSEPFKKPWWYGLPDVWVVDRL